ncbi:hypothetical protein DU478_21405 [Thalassococcus profundi]|uniref:Uncharacterized protein n=1 Tax=Thalassococcus profundi TaxID=2282382 RepID=A0A369TFY5_9RHOB|nr:hypothetical protein DU478_21405 [Thalassococcus profundi]
MKRVNGGQQTRLQMVGIASFLLQKIRYSAAKRRDNGFRAVLDDPEPLQRVDFVADDVARCLSQKFGPKLWMDEARVRPIGKPVSFGFIGGRRKCRGRR